MAGKILLADESLNAQRLWAQCLMEMGYQVTAVSNGAAAVERLPDLRPDLVIADSGLSGISGKELCSIVRQHPEWGRIPLILTLKAFDQGTEEELRAAGASAVLRKPFSPAVLEKIVNELLQSKPTVHEAPSSEPAPSSAEPQGAARTAKAAPIVDLLQAVLEEAALTAPPRNAPAPGSGDTSSSLLLRQVLLRYLSPQIAERAAAEIERTLPPSRS